MSNENQNSVKDNNIFNFSSQNMLIFLLPVLFLTMKKGAGTLSFSEIDHVGLEKKTKLLNRIKGYMSPEEQSIVHRAETILLTVAKVKSIFEGPEVRGAETHYNSLSLDDRKRNMLMDISEFVDDERREAIYKAVEIHSKARTMQDRLGRLQTLSNNDVTIDTIESYIDAFDPILEGELKNKAVELRKIIGILKLLKTVNNKNGVNEMDLIDAVKSFMPAEQAESLGRMLQIVKAVSTIGNEANNSTTANNNGQGQASLLPNPAAPSDLNTAVNPTDGANPAAETKLSYPEKPEGKGAN